MLTVQCLQQLSSSLPSVQSAPPSQRQDDGIHCPLLHLHWELEHAVVLILVDEGVLEHAEILTLVGWGSRGKVNSRVLTAVQFITAISTLPVSITTLVGWDTLSIVTPPLRTGTRCNKHHTNTGLMRYRLFYLISPLTASLLQRHPKKYSTSFVAFCWSAIPISRYIFLRVATTQERHFFKLHDTDRMEDEETHCLKEGGVCADARDWVNLKRHCHTCPAMDTELKESDPFADVEEDEDELEENKLAMF